MAIKIDHCADRWFVVRALKAFYSLQAQEEVEEFSRRFKAASEKLDRALAAESRKIVSSLGTSPAWYNSAVVNTWPLLTEEDMLMNKLKPISSSDYRYEEARFCMKDTRVSVLNRLVSWCVTPLQDHGTRLLWLCGMAGVGKSAIARSLCKSLDEEQCLAASFFLRYDDHDRSNPRLVIPTLAFRFAMCWEPYRQALIGVLRNISEVTAKSPTEQVTHLILEPLRTVLSSPDVVLTILVDALDECSTADEMSREMLIKALCALSQSKPWLKVLILGRPDDNITMVLDDVDNLCLTQQDLFDEDAASDISHFLGYRLLGVAKQSRLIKTYPDWPGEARIMQLVDRSNNLFIWAQTVYELLRSSTDPEHELNEILSYQRIEGGYASVYQLYRTTLERAVEQLGQNDRLFRIILGGIIATSSFFPLPDNVIVALLRSPTTKITNVVFENQVSRLQAVLYRDGNDRVRVYHLSFIDYVTSTVSGCPERFRIDLGIAHTEIAIACLSVMTSSLRFNAFSMTTSSISNDDPLMSESRALANRDPLRYCCVHWGDHLAHAGPGGTSLRDLIQILFSNGRVLPWLEVLSLVGEVKSSLSALENVIRWCAVCAVLYQPTVDTDVDG